MQYFQRMGEITVAKKASSKFASLRTTIPMSIVRQWKLEDGNKLDWEWKVIEGQLAIVVSKV
ncbi:MAG: AbrB family transcriptional regulator [Nitrososphaeraceae archaeon]|nr:AbrB family transcriptional regulator [Nitrososphaeraceae archaeon]